ncbi:MAG TPA: c-type cytochrome [Solirubrobacteraceae bacterium]|nr:c-type cytochrome [Solirubrobacteraceae bacterium]
MLAVILFLGFWVVLALGLFFVAARGGLGGARNTLQAQSRGGRRAAAVTFAFIFIAFGVVIPAVTLAGNHRNSSKQYAGVSLNASDKRGRELFGEHCGFCHTLAAANAVGKVGPNLDVLQPPQSLVLHTINYGCLQNAPSSDPQTCLGYGTMPAALVQGQDATDVANFVARVAGK